MIKNIFKFGEIMAKKAKKAAKKAVKNVEVLAPPVTPKAAASSVDVRKHIEEISKTRKDAATVWSVITDGHTDDDIRVIVKSLEFETLLGEIS
tara:strand:+ start:336 stop:614 length:279 start_codon:yes stop_codon:yes gene_type:complete